MCGIIGVYGTPSSFQEVYQGLLLLQHRGQDAAGLLSFDFYQHSFHHYKDLGLISEVFSKDVLNSFQGQMSIAHTRYATVGPKNAIDSKRDIQPMMINFPFGIGMVHNGNLVNYFELKKYLHEVHSRHLFTENDLEVLINLLSDSLCQNKNQSFNFEILKLAIHDLFEKAKGGYSVVGALADKGLFAFRDPHGLRPLVLGVRDLSEEEKLAHPQHFNKSYIVSSETNALNFLGYEVLRDLEPGEVIFIDQNGTFFTSTEYSFDNKIKTSHCMFEWIYFANPESAIEGQSVYGARLNLGAHLAKEIQKLIDENNINPDIIVPVPETSRVAAISLSEHLKIPYREVLIKNRYIQRSFILNTQESRKRAVQLKLTAIASEIKGKNVLLLDDSIVRGTTSKRIIEMVKEAGAKEVYFASTCPPIKFPCFYGVDFPDPNELIANQKNSEEIARELGADKLIYLSIDSTQKSIGKKDLCMACVNGCYPVDMSASSSFSSMRSLQRE